MKNLIEMYYQRLKRKNIVKHEGIPIFWIVYKPQNSGENVIFSYLHPDIINNIPLKTCMSLTADRVREFYAKHPELLEEILKCVEK